MLYEVITGEIGAGEGRHTVTVFVITSYSIHYTKLYDDIRVRARNDVDRNHFADLGGGGSTGVGRGLHRAHVAADHRGHEARADS